MRRDEDRGGNFTRRRNLAGSEAGALDHHGCGTGWGWSDNGGRSIAAYDAAVLLGRVSLLPGMLAAAVGRSLRGLQADSKRRKQGCHQEEDNRRALEKAAPHEGSLPRDQSEKVIWITLLQRQGALKVPNYRGNANLPTA
jgi:hypothetical protein